MVYEESLLVAIEEFGSKALDIVVWRHTLGERPAFTPNVAGARWNPAGVAALYTSLSREAAIAEGSWLLAAQPILSQAPRRVHQMKITLERVLDLSSLEALTAFGIDRSVLEGDAESWPACQRVGGAVAFLGLQALLVPSLRSEGGGNLVFYTDKVEAGAGSFEVIVTEDL